MTPSDLAAVFGALKWIVEVPLLALFLMFVYWAAPYWRKR